MAGYFFHFIITGVGYFQSYMVIWVIYSGWWFGTMEFYDFHFIYGITPTPLTNSIIFQDGYCTTNQIKIQEIPSHASGLLQAIVGQ